MSIDTHGIILDKPKRPFLFFVFALGFVQVVLSAVLYISFAANILWPDTTRGAVGVAQMLSYEGRLTDSSGNPLGGTGEPYCFRFSIYDNPNAGSGTKLWPSGSPSTTMATATDGIYSALIGQADALDYNFYDSDTVYLNVEVNTATSTCAGSWQTLNPRQRIAASGYTIASKNVYGDLLRTDISNSRVQIGTGAGGASPKYLGLDVKNTADYVGESCTTSGTVWYNSAISKALVCENSVIQAISNNSATSTIAAITTNTASPAITGTVVFSNSNGVTFGINGNTITASVNAAGGDTLSSFEPYPAISASALLGSNNASSGAASFLPFNAGEYIDADYMNLAASMSFVTLGNSAGSQSFSFNYGLYSKGTGASSSILSRITSHSFSIAVSASNSSYTISQPTSTNSAGFTYSTTASAGSNISSGYTGFKMLQLPVNSVMTPGVYWLGLFDRNSSSSISGGIKMSIAGLAVGTSLANMAPIGSFSTAFSTGTNATRSIGGNWYAAAGSFTSAAQTNLPGSVALSALTHNLNVRPYIRIYGS